MRSKLVQKMTARKTTECSKYLRHIAIKKYIFQNLINRCICQMSLKYIKLVIPKILFILVLYIFNFNLKLSDNLQQNYPLPTEKKFLTPPPRASKDFSKLFNRPPIWRRGVHAMLYI